MPLRSAIYGLVQRTRGRDYLPRYGVIKRIMSDRSLLERSKEGFLRDLVLHSYDNVPYYRPLFERSGLVSEGKLDLGRFERVPLLTKGIIRSNLSRIVSSERSSRRPYWFDTSGSTGEPLHFLLDNVYDSWIIAAWQYYFRDMLGIDYRGSRKLVFWPPARLLPRGPRRSVTQWITNEIGMTCLRFSEVDLSRIVRLLDSYRPDLIIGPPAVIFELSRFMKLKDAHAPKLRGILTNSEPLEDVSRGTIETAFDTRVYDTYGSNEASAIAGECREGVKHVFTFINHLELLESPNLGGGGEVVLTPLHNFTMPLVRYSVGDVAFRGPASCSCGSPLPTLKGIIGRTIGFFVKEGGDLISGSTVLSLFRLNRAVEAFQIVQEEHKKVRITVVLNRMDSHWQERVDRVIRLALGSDCKILWELVEEIPLSPSGKRIMVKSLLHQ